MSRHSQESVSSRPHLGARRALVGTVLTAAALLPSALHDPRAEQLPRAASAPDKACAGETIVAQIQGHMPNAQRAAFLSGLAKLESGGDWKIIEQGGPDRETFPKGTGAFQYTGPGWKYYAGYDEAWLAPPAVQYTRAQEDVDRDAAATDDWRQVAYAQIIGAENARANECNQPDWIKHFGDVVLTYMNQGLADPKTMLVVPDMPVRAYNPELA